MLNFGSFGGHEGDSLDHRMESLLEKLCTAESLDCKTNRDLVVVARGHQRAFFEGWRRRRSTRLLPCCIVQEWQDDELGKRLLDWRHRRRPSPTEATAICAEDGRLIVKSGSLKEGSVFAI